VDHAGDRARQGQRRRRLPHDHARHEDRFSKGSRQLFASNVASLGDYQLVFGKGGVPIVDHGQVIGAVGVSGADPRRQRHAIAEAAAGGKGQP